ncbi:hypothetical protein DFH27DRAFT_227058 [Peziza echinospora]|nr:hypothetical protein DFH27DRAFT_227058 [Peziza echinospora]
MLGHALHCTITAAALYSILCRVGRDYNWLLLTHLFYSGYIQTSYLLCSGTGCCIFEVGGGRGISIRTRFRIYFRVCCILAIGRVVLCRILALKSVFWIREKERGRETLQSFRVVYYCRPRMAGKVGEGVVFSLTGEGRRCLQLESAWRVFTVDINVGILLSLRSANRSAVKYIST